MILFNPVHHVSSRRRAVGFAATGLALAALTLVGCMLEPFDGQVVREGDRIFFEGYTPDPDASVVIEVEVPDPDPEPCDDTRIAPEDQASGGALCATPYVFVPVRTVRPDDTAGGGLKLFDNDDNRFFHWQASVQLPPRAFHHVETTDGRFLRGARVRARQQGGFVYTSVREDWASCYNAHHTTLDDFHTHCSANPEHVAVLIAE